MYIHTYNYVCVCMYVCMPGFMKRCLIHKFNFVTLYILRRDNFIFEEAIKPMFCHIHRSAVLLPNFKALD